MLVKSRVLTTSTSNSYLKWSVSEDSETRVIRQLIAIVSNQQKMSVTVALTAEVDCDFANQTAKSKTLPTCSPRADCSSLTTMDIYAAWP